MTYLQLFPFGLANIVDRVYLHVLTLECLPAYGWRVLVACVCFSALACLRALACVCLLACLCVLACVLLSCVCLLAACGLWLVSRPIEFSCLRHVPLYLCTPIFFFVPQCGGT